MSLCLPGPQHSLSATQVQDMMGVGKGRRLGFQEKAEIEREAVATHTAHTQVTQTHSRGLQEKPSDEPINLSCLPLLPLFFGGCRA